MSNNMRYCVVSECHLDGETFVGVGDDGRGSDYGAGAVGVAVAEQVYHLIDGVEQKDRHVT